MEETDEEAVPLLQEKTELQQHILTNGFAKYIFVCEFFEGVVLKGLFAVIALFFLESLLYDENTATELVHFFMFITSSSYIVGAVISDGYIGHYKTTLSFFTMQLCGLILLCAATLVDPEWRKPLAFVGLLLTGFGVGGRPAFLTFGCDQVMWSVYRKAAGNLESGESRAELMARSQGTASRQYFSSMYMFKKIWLCCWCLAQSCDKSQKRRNFLLCLPPVCLCKCHGHIDLLVGQQALPIRETRF
ncbi:hypothetical protein Mapa_001098 [Marchantia paleacea]|nr:hypothetical protein Mapa_001098 [Marchantia paleacea]